MQFPFPVYNLELQESYYLYSLFDLSLLNLLDESWLLDVKVNIYFTSNTAI